MNSQKLNTMDFLETLAYREKLNLVENPFGVCISDFAGMKSIAWFKTEDELNHFLKKIWGPEELNRELPDNYLTILKSQTDVMPNEVDGLPTKNQEWGIKWISTYRDLMNGDKYFEVGLREEFYWHYDEVEEKSDPISTEKETDFIEFINSDLFIGI